MIITQNANAGVLEDGSTTSSTSSAEITSKTSEKAPQRVGLISEVANFFQTPSVFSDQ